MEHRFHAQTSVFFAGPGVSQMPHLYLNSSPTLGQESAQKASLACDDKGPHVDTLAWQPLIRARSTGETLIPVVAI